MADDGDTLLREVEEELRRERMEKFWQRYSGLILGGAAAVVLGVAGYKYLESSRMNAAEAAGKQFDAAVTLADQAKTDDAIKAFQDIAANGPRGYASLAKLHIAGAHAKAGKTADAVAAYESLANDAGADQLLKNFAQLQAASLRMPEADFTEMQNRLNSLTGELSPYKVTASEMLGFAAFKAGKYEEARKLLEPLLIDPKATAAIQDRIKVVMAQIAAAELAAAAPVAPATAPAPAPAPSGETPKAAEPQPAQPAGGTPAPATAPAAAPASDAAPAQK